MSAGSDYPDASRATTERPASGLGVVASQGGGEMQLMWWPRPNTPEGNRRFYYDCREDKELKVWVSLRGSRVVRRVEWPESLSGKEERDLENSMEYACLVSEWL